MSKNYDIAVVGATGSVGREILEILEQRNFPVKNIFCLASERSEGEIISFRDTDIKVIDLKKFNFTDIDLALFSPGASVSKKFAPVAADKGCLVIDNTSYFRMEENIPLIVPEINSNELNSFFSNKKKKNIISNPNCSTIQMVLALKPLHDLASIRRIVVSTYQSVSGKGKKGMDELFNQTKNIYRNENITKKEFTKQIAFNVIPHIDSFLENGNTKEEQKMIDETKKILDKNINVSATCVRVPVMIGHAESINIEFNKPISEDQAKKALQSFKGVSLVDYRQDDGYVTPLECAGDDKVYVSRLRSDPTIENGLSLWVVSDNLRKGAALNAVQIAENIIKNKYL